MHSPDSGSHQRGSLCDDLDRSSDFIDRADVLVICRTQYDHKIGQMIARARARGLSLLYDIDDLIFDLRHAHTIGEAINRPLQTSEDWDWWCAYIGRLGMTIATMRRGDHDKLVPRPTYRGIRSAAERQGDRKLFKSMAKRDIPYHLPTQVDDAFQRDDKVHIGYFSGTNTHYRLFSRNRGSEPACRA